MTRADVVIGIVSAEGGAEAALVAAVEALGATAEVCTEATAISRAAGFDAVVFDLGEAPSRFLPVAAALAVESRTRWLPRVLIVPEDVCAAQLAPFGPATLVAASAGAEAVSRAIDLVVDRVLEQTELVRRARADKAALRLAEQQLVMLQKEGETLSHDARVLFGVILGYASNLRDGIAGPVKELQRGHLVNIMGASTDAGALLDRYVTMLRGTVRESNEEDAALASRAPPRRRHNDLAELVRTTVALFAGVASAKQIRLRATAERATPSWCDAMQIKQALVNLLTNALKFTPRGGSVEVTVRPGPPASVRGGATPRREVEILVTDSGPGIPASERGRVFERGARLERDCASPGSGIGLAVVRDVVEQHGGAVVIEDSDEGGASFVVTLPVDLRSRASDPAELRDAAPISARIRTSGTPRGGGE